jgi:NADH dehydrogenase
VHLTFLIQFENKFLVLCQWAWNYFTRNRSARLITGPVEAAVSAEKHTDIEPAPAVSEKFNS